MTLEEAHHARGRKVVYSSHPGEADLGVLTGVKGPYVFVRFGDATFPVACYPEDLTLMRGRSLSEHFALVLRETGYPAGMEA